MDSQIEGLYQKIGQSISNSLTEQWVLAWIDMEIKADVEFFKGRYLVSQSADPKSFKVPQDTINAFEKLQKLMINPSKPNWKKAHFELYPDGKFDLKFEY